MSTNLVGLKQLKIMIKTSIPDKDEYIDFTSDLLNIKNKGRLSKLPFFVDNKPYPKIKLQNFSYERIVDFFFNKTTFKQIMQNTTRKNRNEKKTNRIKIDNFELTLRLLFPTTFPLVNNIDNSLEYIIPSRQIFTIKGSNTFNVLPRRFDQKFSYLKIGSEIYTITKTIWNNDVMNHPIYSEILQTYKQFDLWKSDPSNNFLNNAEDETTSMNEILTKVIEKVYESSEEPLLKPMYPNREKAPYAKSISSKDDNVLRMQDFDNAVYTIMQKDERYLQHENTEYENEIFTIIDNIGFNDYNDTHTLKKNFEIGLNKLPIDNTYIDNFKADFKTRFNTDNRDVKDNVNNLFDLLYKINDNEHNIQKLKKNKSKNTNDMFYKYFEKGKEEKEEKIKKILSETPEYKLRLINLLGKLTLVKDPHNVSSDFTNLIEYLNTNITKKFDKNRKIRSFIKDLNIKFLNNPNYKDEEEIIQNYYIEFYNLALVISKLKGRLIDNPIWNSVVSNMRNGTLKNDDFNTNIWKKIQNCYDIEDDNDNDTEDKKKKPSVSKGTCDGDAIEVGLDIITGIPSTSSSKTAKTKIQTIEIYLQMDLIEGEVNENNMNKIKCAYDDEFLGSMFRDLTNTSKQINTFPSQQIFFSAKKLLEDNTDNADTKKKGGSIKPKAKRTTKKIRRI